MKKINNETKKTTNQTATQVKIKWEKPKVIRLGETSKHKESQFLAHHSVPADKLM